MTNRTCHNIWTYSGTKLNAKCGDTYSFVAYFFLSCPYRTSSVTHRIRVEVTECGTSCHAAGPVGHARALLIGCTWLFADLVAIEVSIFQCCMCQLADTHLTLGR